MIVNFYRELIMPILIDWKNYFVYLYEEYHKYRQRRGFKRAKKRADNYALVNGNKVVYLFHNPSVGYYYGTRDQIQYNLTNNNSKLRKIMRNDLSNSNHVMPKRKPKIDISIILSRALYITHGPTK